MSAPDISNDVKTALLIDPLPAAAGKSLLLDDAFCSKLGIKPRFFYPLDDKLSVETGSLHAALRAAVAGSKTGRVLLRSGKQIRVKLGTQAGGKATLLYKKEGFTFSNADLLSAECWIRLEALKRVFASQPLAAPEEQRWRTIAETRPFSDREYDDLMTALGATPEAFRLELLKPQELSADRLMPDSSDYYGRLLAKLEKSADLESFIGNELAFARLSLLERSPTRALRRIAYSALWQPLVPFDLFQEIDTATLSPLLTAEDPFSLLFGFEICRAQLDKDAAFADLGGAFLEKLFADPSVCKSRCEIFAACALITTVGLRRAARASGAPLFWARLAALTHAGVSADALSGIPDSGSFLRWASRNFAPTYIWYGVVDRREAPRWRPEWISPEYIFAELVGRSRNALNMLVEEERPARWVSAIESAITRLADAGMVIASVFPGPFDDFRESQTSPGEAFKEVEEKLKDATQLNKVQGVIALTYATQLSDSGVADALRILNLVSEQPIADLQQELRELEIHTHIAVVAGSDVMAKAVIRRCLYLARDAKGSEMVADIFALMAEACAVHRTEKYFRDELGEAAARICFALDDVEPLAKLLSVFDALIRRDDRLAPALAKARSIAQTRKSRL